MANNGGLWGAKVVSGQDREKRGGDLIRILCINIAPLIDCGEVKLHKEREARTMLATRGCTAPRKLISLVIRLHSARG